MLDQQPKEVKTEDPIVQELLSRNKKTWMFFCALGFLFALFIVATFSLVRNLNESLQVVTEEYDKKVITSIEALSSAGTKQKMYSGTFEERQDNFVRQAKGWILVMQEEGSFYSMSSEDIDILLMTIYKYADLRMVDPRLPLAYIWGESWFNKNALSASGARGLYQFMPSTAKGYLGIEYYEGSEFDLVMSTKAWFYMHDVLKNEYYEVETDRDREMWIANSYVGSLRRAKEAYVQGMSAEEYDQLWPDYHAGYSSTMWDRFCSLKEIIVLN